MNFKIQIGEMVTEKIQELKLSQAEVARRADVCNVWLCRMLRGKADLRLQNIAKLFKTLSIPLSALDGLDFSISDRQLKKSFIRRDV
ncbi:helix-turn-helix domain-containing protein [Bdellovibrio bacteriovorus]